MNTIMKSIAILLLFTSLNLHAETPVMIKCSLLNKEREKQCVIPFLTHCGVKTRAEDVTINEKTGEWEGVKLDINTKKAGKMLLMKGRFILVEIEQSKRVTYVTNIKTKFFRKKSIIAENHGKNWSITLERAL